MDAATANQIEVPGSQAPEVDDATSDQIEKDASRSGRLELGISDEAFPNHREALQLLLKTYVAKSGGTYHQSMSLIGGSLLAREQLDVDAAQSAFEALMSSLPPGFYAEDLLGCRIEVRSLRHLAFARWPHLFRDSKVIHEPLDIVSMQWMLSIYASVLPTATCHLMWRGMEAEATASEAGAHLAGSSMPLRVGLVLLGALAEPLHEALLEDTAVDESGGCATYAVLQRAVAEWEANCKLDENETKALHSILAAAASIELPAAELEDVRKMARREVEAEDAVEQARKVTLRAAAILDSADERELGRQAASKSYTAATASGAAQAHGLSCRGMASSCLQYKGSLSVAGFTLALCMVLYLKASPPIIGLLAVMTMLVTWAHRQRMHQCGRATLDIFVRQSGEPGSLSHTIRRLRTRWKRQVRSSLAARDGAAAVAPAVMGVGLGADRPSAWHFGAPTEHATMER